MALIKIPKEMGSTPGIVDNSNATAITIDSSENATFAGALTSNGVVTVDIGATAGNVLVLDKNTGANIALQTAGTTTGNITTTAARLDIGAANYQAFSILNAAPNNSVIIDGSGNVGIGTATPQKKFHIEHTAGASEGILISGASDTAGHTAGVLLRAEGGEADSALRAKAGIFLERTATYGIGKLHIANRHNSDNVSATISDAQITVYDNKVGIGTTSPDNKLSINTGAAADGIRYDVSYSPVNSAPRGTMTWDDGNASGNVTGQIDTRYDGTTVDLHIGSLYSGGYNSLSRLVVKGNGNVSITDGNLAFASGHGIDFSANANAAGSSSELLDDYETGTWTPTLIGCDAVTFSGGNLGVYVKIGALVHVQWYSSSFTVSNAVSGNARVGGLPFAGKSGKYGSASFAHTQAFTNSAVQGYTNSTATEVYVSYEGATSGNTWSQGFPKYVMMSCVYSTDS